MPPASPARTNHMATVLIKAIGPCANLEVLDAAKCSFTNGTGFMTNFDLGNERLDVNMMAGGWSTSGPLRVLRA